MILSYPIEKCPECGSNKILIDKKRAEIVCRNCGYVITENLPYVGENVLVSEGSKRIYFLFPHVEQTKDERNLFPVMRKLNLASSLLKMPRYFKMEIMKNYIKLYKKKWTFGRDSRAILASLVLIFARKYHLPYYIKDIEIAFQVNERKIRSYVKKVCSELKLK